MKIYHLLFAGFFGIFTFSQSITDNKGKIIDTVYINDSREESFAAYVPNKFNKNQLSPVVFIFDPMANGSNGIKPFIKTSDKYGYILICSNNSRNAGYQKNFDIANRLFDKVFKLFNIHPKRIYTAGFSGGARLASTIAVLTKQIQGVVACGAGFSKNPNHIPIENTFSYAAIVGDLDMNYNELYNTTGFLNKLKIPNELFVYNFNHKWPTSDQILTAFDWLELEAYRKNIIQKNDVNILDIYNTSYKKALNLEHTNNLVYALKSYDQIIKNFSPYILVDSIKQKSKFLKKDKTQKKQLKLLESSFKKEKLLTEKFKNQFSLDFMKPNGQNLSWWKKEINLLKKEQLSSNGNYKKMYGRLLYKIFAMAIETATIGNNIKNIDQSILCYDICLNIYPKYYGLYFKQVENYIKNYERKKALDHVELLLTSGYNDKQKLRNYKGFEPIKNEARFIALTKD